MYKLKEHRKKDTRRISGLRGQIPIQLIACARKWGPKMLHEGAGRPPVSRGAEPDVQPFPTVYSYNRFVFLPDILSGTELRCATVSTA